VSPLTRHALDPPRSWLILVGIVTHARAATSAAIATTGTVLGWNAIVLAMGFLVLTFSSLPPNRDLGLSLSTAIVACYVCAMLFLPRLLPLIGSIALLLIPAFVALVPSIAVAADCQAEGDPTADPKADALMAAIERNFRRDARVVRMNIRTQYARAGNAYRGVDEPNDRTLWGVFDGDAEETRLLYVFTGPGRLAGTTLLIHDQSGSDEHDSMWLYLRSFGIFKKLESKTQRATVPGTALTYEDSRGFIPVDKYRFRFAGSTAQGGVSILGCPRTAGIRDNLGYRSLTLRVDSDKKIVLAVEYADLIGRPFKSYTLLSHMQMPEMGERVFPEQVRVEHRADSLTTEIGYEYWFPEISPPQTLFEPSTEQGRFIDRLKAYVTKIGQGERIGMELELADERVRQFEERLHRMLEAERRGQTLKE